jgi:uncharacterized damage-inducible protein DinB
MPNQALPLTHVYQGWDTFQRDLVKAVAPLSAEQLALPIAPAQWPIGLLVQHIINDRVWWFNGWMNEGGPDVTAFMHWDEETEGRSVHTAGELVAGLQSTWEMVAATLARNTTADLDHVFAPPAMLTEREREIFGPSTRQEIIFHVMRHDIHHGGELAIGLGGHGLPSIWG